MADDARTTSQHTAPAGAGPDDGELLDGGADLPGDSELVRLNHDEWSTLCADLERWLSTRLRPR